jgi:hypothetical protein
MGFLGTSRKLFGKGGRADPAEVKLEKDIIVNLSFLPKQLSVNLTTLFSMMELPNDNFERFVLAVARVADQGTFEVERRREAGNENEILYIKLRPELWEQAWSTAKATFEPEYLERIESARLQMLVDENHQA